MNNELGIMNNKKPKIKKFTDLDAWKEGHKLVLMVYKITKDMFKRYKKQDTNKFKFQNFKLFGYWNLRFGICLYLVSCILVSSVSATMQSDNYIIYETVLHSFEGPVVSGISCSGSTVTSVTVAWTTDVIADGFVIYDTNNSFSASKEQGSSAKTSASHSVIVSGLESSTTYYYKVRSTRLNGGSTSDSTVYSCDTTAVAEEEAAVPGGGGILIIDKRDKVAPLVSNVQVINVRGSSATIVWETDESATGFVEYGTDINYGNTFGQWAYGTSHSVILENLTSETAYHFRVLSSDESGNLGKSEDQVFTTISLIDEIGIDIGIEPEDEQSAENILAEASRKAIEIMEKFASQVSLNVLESTLSSQYDAIKRLAGLVPPPILSGEPRVEVQSDRATVYWTTDKEATSLVAIASEAEYNPGAPEPYARTSGDSENLTTEHEVRIFGLEPGALYHYQLRSKSAAGALGQSRDFTFRTSLETLEITNYYTEVINDSTAAFKWVTNFNSDSAIKFAPYRNGILSVEESKIIKDNVESVIHEITIEEFEGGVVYEIELQSQDAQGNMAVQSISLFSTTKDDLPPVVSNIKVDSTVFLDKEGKIQTIISWLTNEPSTSL
ncbi:fibronectin type III domain-containing protein, partial [Candidatus Parcubacteria bacterium]|nr:fibronectin type III domain-containing protein [Candidatus Parcubacteria bacterium]